MKAFVDVLTVVNAEHHQECMSKVTTGCVTCGKTAQDALKSPMSYLHLEQPMIMIMFTPVCGSKECDIKARKELEELQKRVMQGDDTSSGSLYGAVSCEVCQKPNAKRCAGCGSSAYCSKECQKAMWVFHKRTCRRKKITEADAEDPVDLPYETI